jgi:hypothetical protein
MTADENLSATANERFRVVPGPTRRGQDASPLFVQVNISLVNIILHKLAALNVRRIRRRPH